MRMEFDVRFDAEAEIWTALGRCADVTIAAEADGLDLLLTKLGEQVADVLPQRSTEIVMVVAGLPAR